MVNAAGGEFFIENVMLKKPTSAGYFGKETTLELHVTAAGSLLYMYISVLYVFFFKCLHVHACMHIVVVNNSQMYIIYMHHTCSVRE